MESSAGERRLIGGEGLCGGLVGVGVVVRAGMVIERLKFGGSVRFGVRENYSKNFSSCNLAKLIA